MNPSQELDVNGNFRLRGALYDVNNDAGVSGEILKSTANGIDWIDGSIYMDNTDNQTLSFNSSTNILSITGPSSSIVSLSTLAGDNLGDHTATQNIRLNSFWLSNDGSNEGININNSGHIATSGHVTIDDYLYMDDYGNGNTTSIQASAIGRNGSFVFYDGGVYVGLLASTSSISVGTGDLQVAGNAAIGGNLETNIKLRVHGRLKSSGIEELSDKRWKKDVEGIENALEKVLAMNGVYYNWRKDEFPEQGFTDNKQVGFIAQELEDIFPEVVNTDVNGYKSVMYGHIVSLLVEAIKDLEGQLQEKTISLEEQSIEIETIKASLNEIHKILGINKEMVKK